MKKAITITFGLMGLVFGLIFSSTKIEASEKIDDIYSPIVELNNNTLQEVSDNINLALPDLTGKTEISTGVYRFYDDNGITIDYEVNSGIFTVDGTSTDVVYYDVTSIFSVGVYSISYYYVSGSIPLGTIEISIGISRIDNTNEDYNTDKTLSNQNITQNNAMKMYIDDVDYTFNQYKFKYQIEVGSTVTPYQVPKIGPTRNLVTQIISTVTEWMTGFWNFIKATITSAIGLFYEPTTGLTVIGVLALFGLAVGLVYFGLSFVTRFFKK